ncbi:hypothetical protein AHAS_Ahas11G0138600 [Arachis hypogaea]
MVSLHHLMVMVLSGSEPSDDEFSSDDDEDDDENDTLEGADPHNPIDLSCACNSSIEVSEESNETRELSDNRYTPCASYEKTITCSDLILREYLAYNFATYLKLSGDGSVWKITGPPSSVGKNIFFFHLLKTGERNRE